MSTTTTYDVALRFRLEGSAGRGADELAHKLGAASHGANELSHVLGHLGAIAGGALGIHGAWEHLIKFNAEVENAKIGMASMIEGGFGGSFEYAKAQAESMYSTFQRFSQKLPLTTQQLQEFSNGVALGVRGAGGGIGDIVNITERGAAAAKAFGFESHLAAREISELLNGNIRNTEPFTMALANAGHKSLEELRKMSGSERLDFLKQTLNSSAMNDAIGQMSQSFSGVTSTLVDKLQILAGKVGLPLFRAITAEVSRWNEWIDKNNEAIERFAHQVGHDLVSAFVVVKDVFGFIYDHADAFIAIGKTWAAIKLGGMLGGGVSGLLGGVGGVRGLGKDLLMGELSKEEFQKLSAGKRFGVGAQNILGAIGPAAAVGLGSYELAKAAGLDKVGEEIGESVYSFVNGADSVGMRFARLERSSAALDQAYLDSAARMGLAVSTSASLMQGSVANSHQIADTISAFLKAQQDLDNVPKYSSKYGEALAHFADTKDALKNLGLDDKSPDELRKIQRDEAEHAQKMGARYDLESVVAGGFVQAFSIVGLTDYQAKTLNSQKATNEAFTLLNRTLSNGGLMEHLNLIGDMMKILRDNTADPEGRHKTMVEKPKVNVTIHRIEVQSDDPDRMAFGLLQSFRDAAKNPSSALHTLREG